MKKLTALAAALLVGGFAASAAFHGAKDIKSKAECKDKKADKKG